MAVPSSLTLNYDAVLSTTLFNMMTEIQDEISTSNVLLFYMMKKQPGAWDVTDDIGDRVSVPLMYQLAPTDSYSGADILDTSPVDGVTDAFYNWGQFSAPISITGLDEQKNSGEARLISLIDTKTQQAVASIQDMVGRSILQGNGPNSSSAITTPYTSPNNGSVFFDPLFLHVKFDPTTSTTIGNINQSTNTWWRNQAKDFTGVNSFTGFLKNLRNLRNNTSKGPGGQPNLHVVSQLTYELYETALATNHRNPSYDKADIPFDAIAFYKQPVVWDEFVPDVKNGTTTQTTGTWAMLNTKYLKFKVSKARNFTPTEFQKPFNQDIRAAHIFLLAAFCSMNRRKQGVGGGIDTSIVS